MLLNRLNKFDQHPHDDQEERALSSNRQIERNVEDEWRNEMNEKTRKNFMLIGSNKESISKL